MNTQYDLKDSQKQMIAIQDALTFLQYPVTDVIIGNISHLLILNGTSDTIED